MAMFSAERFSLMPTSRMKLANAIVLSIFALLVLRLWYLQIIKGDYFKEQSESNRFKQVYVTPARGEILDRNGRILVANRPAFNIELVREDAPDIKATIAKLAQVTGHDYEQLLKMASASQAKRRAFEPRVLIADADRDLVAKVAAFRYALPGIVINTLPARVYVENKLAAHLLGYIREIRADQLEAGQYSGYRPGDLVGQMGVEQLEEYLLFGKRGVQHVIVNAVGTRISEIYSEPDVPGHTVMLTIDYAAQKAADEALAGKTGAVVAMNPNTGEILALASQPSFDPNIFSTRVSADQWAQLNSSSEKPLTNRALAGEYPPGSVFKMIMAVAGLAEGVITPHSRVNCKGSFRVGNSRPFSCMKKQGHGSLDLYEALKLSCNVYFYTLGQQLGIDRIHDYAVRFGFGQSSSLGMGGERAGLVPSTAWKRKAFKNPSDKRWYPGETPSVSIGQGALVVTPLQVARATAALVNGGRLFKPAIIRRVSDNDRGSFDERFQPQMTGLVGVDPNVLSEVKKAMTLVVNDERGTAYLRGRLSEDLGAQMGGKTGTAQTRALVHSNKSMELGWFTGFAPIDKPEIVIAVMVEGEGGGGVAAAPIARAVVEAYLKGLKFSGDADPLPLGQIAASDSANNVFYALAAKSHAQY